MTPLSITRLDAAEVARRGGPRAAARSLRELVPAAKEIEQQVAEIIARVRGDGDAALREYTRRFDGATPSELAVAPDDLDRALAAMEGPVHDGLQNAIANVMLVARAAVGADALDVALPQGQLVRLREIPVERAAVYVPGGRAPYPSTVVMGVVTARAAGVADVVVVAPPGADGAVHPLILGASRLCGASAVYRVGGAQAIAALAYGTASIDPVDVIVGPGNLYVQEAKRQVSAAVGIDGFAGPSDLLVIASDAAPMYLLALDLLAQAEHGEDSLVVATSAEASLLDELAAWIERFDGEHPGAAKAPLVLVQTEDLHGAWELGDELAPEHLQLVGAQAESLAPRVRRAGCLFVGWPSGTAFGDYIAGSNHILPTAGAARFASGLGPRHFRRSMAEVHVGGAVAALAHAASPIAEAEGFELHAASMRLRAPETSAPETNTAETVEQQQPAATDENGLG